MTTETVHNHRLRTLGNGSLIGAAELAWQPVLDDPALLGA
jgi:hypothetical protein